MTKIIYELHVSLFHSSGHEEYTVRFRTKAERDGEIRFLKREMTGMNYSLTKSEVKNHE